jgi:ppGpp synthetase/RelA/SpoT-type nucleotidyltranferase
LDFDEEKKAFRDFYNANQLQIESAKLKLMELLRSLTENSDDIQVSKVEGRVKARDECLEKFTRKYRLNLEESNTPYRIRDHITDVIGLRIVCLYEDQVNRVRKILEDNFEILSITDKSNLIEETETEFGYKGLHVDARLKGHRRNLPEYKPYRDFAFEVQIKTVVQDSWSSVDHKIKYKKSIPVKMKRRINTLAALFELADREFMLIRDETESELEKSVGTYPEIDQESEANEESIPLKKPTYTPTPLDVFSFNRIAGHFFPEYEFEAYKVDGFVADLKAKKSSLTRGKFNFYLKETISIVKQYSSFFEEAYLRPPLNPYTIIRHCLYLGDKPIYSGLLTQAAKDTFDEWIEKNYSDFEIPPRSSSGK